MNSPMLIVLAGSNFGKRPLFMLSNLALLSRFGVHLLPSPPERRGGDLHPHSEAERYPRNDFGPRVPDPIFVLLVQC